MQSCQSSVLARVVLQVQPCPLLTRTHLTLAPTPRLLSGDAWAVSGTCGCHHPALLRCWGSMSCWCSHLAAWAVGIFSSWVVVPPGAAALLRFRDTLPVLPSLKLGLICSIVTVVWKSCTRFIALQEQRNHAERGGCI